MPRLLTRLSVVAVTAAALTGIVVTPAAAVQEPAATAALYLTKVGDQIDGLAYQSDPAVPFKDTKLPTYEAGSDLHPGWTVNLTNARAIVSLTPPERHSVGQATGNFMLYDGYDPFLRLSGMAGSVACTTTGVWLGGGGNLKLYARLWGDSFPTTVPVEFGTPITLDRVHPGDVVNPGPNDFRLTTVTLTRAEQLAEVAAYPQFAGHDTGVRKGITGYWLTVEQRVSAGASAKTYRFLVGASACSI